MKKSLLLLSAVAIASLANAQVVVGLTTSEELQTLGFTEQTLTPMTIVTTDVADFGIAYEDTWKNTTTYKTYRNVTVAGEAIELGSGAVGSTNPNFTSYADGVMSAGAVFKYSVKKDGYLTVFTKINPNKQYVVFEGSTSGLPYTLGYSNGSTKIFYSLPANEDGLLLFDDATAKYYTEGFAKPLKPFETVGLESAPGESTGFVTFNVLGDNDYYFSALGSKCAVGGFVYTETLPDVTFEAVVGEDGTETAPKVEFNMSAAVETLGAAAVENADAPVYNMMGVRVNADAKGILIQNGKKFIRK